jgi:quinol monooxygenase YgiN
MTESVGVVTYLDFGPSFAEVAAKGLRAWAEGAGSQSGAGGAILLNEVNRSERFALVETWTDQDSLNAHQTSGARQELSTAPGLAAPPDERLGEPFRVGSARSVGPQALYVLVHVDVIPFNLGAVGDWLKAESDLARSASGALQYDIWRQVGRPNHFTVIQAWADGDAYARHVEAAPTRAFRANVMSVKGALYDERLYRRLV